MRKIYLCLVLCFALVASSAWAHFPRPTSAENGMVASAHPLATKAGVSILEAGGNAVDAAIATTFAISVVEPFSAGIGGGGFLMLYDEKTNRTQALDFRERAPLSATRDMYHKNGKADPLLSRDGYQSIAVPGTVHGMWTLHQKYGKLPWKKVVAPAIRLAEKGFAVGWPFVFMTNWRLELLNQNKEAKRIFTHRGKPYEEGDILIQRNLATTLKRIAKDPNDFYTGKTAQLMVKDAQKNGGQLTAEDLKTYQSIWRKPVCGDFMKHQVCSMPPPSSGGVHLIQILNLIDGPKMKKLGWHHPDALHHLIESMRTAYADRAAHLGDPDFFPVPVDSLISKAYAQERLKEIPKHKARTSAETVAATSEQIKRFANNPESPDTSHLTVVDKDRLVVSLTFTINYPFGSGMVAKGTGIVMNDEMDDFAIAPGVPNAYGLVGGEANSVAAKKTPLSSMTPFVVTKNKNFAFAGGSPGGSTIITTSLQLIINRLVYGMTATQAVYTPKIHQQWLPDYIDVEPYGLDQTTWKKLEKRGHKLQLRDPWGNANLIVETPEGKLEGSADPRGEGNALGH